MASRAHVDTMVPEAPLDLPAHVVTMEQKAFLDLPDHQDIMVPKASLDLQDNLDIMAPKALPDLVIWHFVLITEEAALAREWAIMPGKQSR